MKTTLQLIGVPPFSGLSFDRDEISDNDGLVKEKATRRRKKCIILSLFVETIFFLSFEKTNAVAYATSPKDKKENYVRFIMKYRYGKIIKLS